jgi:hypothetical protein
MADKDKDKDKDKDDKMSTRIVNGMATMSAVFVARKLLMFAWTKVTGREPPTNPEDPRVALAEALSWSALVGITMATVRVLAIRAVSRKTLSSADREPANVADR